MRVAFTVAGASAEEEADVLVSAAPQTPVAEVVRLLDDELGAGGADQLFLDGRPLTAGATLVESGLRDGCRVGLGRLLTGDHGAAAAAGAGRFQVRILAGPGAGWTFPVGEGDVVVGRSQEADVRLEDPLVSGRHARIRVFGDGLVVEDLGSTNGLHFEGQPARGTFQWPQGTVLGLGNTLLAWEPGGPAGVSLGRTPDGGLAFSRPPRIPSPPRQTSITIPPAPQEQVRSGLPWIAMLIPLAISLVMVAVTRQPTTLLVALLSPAMLLGNYVTDRHRGGQSHRQVMAAYESDMARAQAELAAAIQAERMERRRNHPDPAQVLETATMPTMRLWERRRTDPDALVLRVGLARLPAEVQLAGAEAPVLEASRWLFAMPVTVALREAGVLGVAGDQAHREALARWLLAQAAVLHSPSDLSLVLLTTSRPEAWLPLRWLPQLRPASDGCFALVGSDEETVGARVRELAALLDRRLATAREDRGAPRRFQDVVVLLDGARQLRRQPRLADILRDGPGVGIHAVCLEDSRLDLPEECGAVCAFDESGRGTLTVERRLVGSTPGVVADQVTGRWTERVSRALAPIRDASRSDASGGIPDVVSLLELLACPEPTPEAIRERWRRGGHSSRATIGVARDGPFTIDLRRDGPHVLLAGTTGSGKSELLKTLVVSLAFANRPDELNFVLVDYKGGAAFQGLEGMPHVVGMMTDLEPLATRRALASLTAELTRREAALDRVRRAGAAGTEMQDVYDYWDARARGASGTEDPMPRLLLVIDEFAHMVGGKNVLDDFVHGLIGIAQRGRSLGVHLVLATQRPGGGVVSPEIRANVNLRVALRVVNDSESVDVLDSPAAARISPSSPGRAFAHLGGARLVEFQSARVGGPRSGSGSATWLRVLSAEALGRPLQSPRGAPDDEADGGRSGLALTVRALRAAAAQLGLGTPRRPWMEPLPTTVLLGDLEEARQAAGSQVCPVPFALEDRPQLQDRRTAALDLEHGGHLLFAGSPRSGRSTALRTLAGAIAARVSPRDVHVYGLDFGNSAALTSLTALPHCGAVVTPGEGERVERLITSLLAEVERRRQLFGEAGFADLSEQRASSAPEDRLPYIVLLVDRWEGFRTAFQDLDGRRIVDSFERLLREASAVGIRVVVSGDTSTFSGVLASAFQTRFVLRFNDGGDYLKAGMDRRRLPAKTEGIPDGRAWNLDSGAEIQVALLDADRSGAGQVAALRAIAAQASEKYGPLPSRWRPNPVAVLPARVTVAQVTAHGALDRPHSPLWALVGVGGDRLEPLGVDLDLQGPGFLVAGPARSGRSTALVGMAASLLEGGCQVLALSPRPSPLRGLEGAAGVVGVLTGEQIPDGRLQEVADGIEGPLAVCVDDVEYLADNARVSDALQTILKKARDRRQALVVAGTASELGGFRGLAFEVRKTRTGLLLCPDGGAGDLLGLRLPRTALCSGPAGRGLLVLGGGYTMIQVPVG